MNTLNLKDIQNQKDTRGIEIQKVGVKDVEIPLIIQRKNNTGQTVSAKARINVSLPKDYKGTHMSRFVEILSEWGQKNLLGVDIYGFLLEVANRLDANSAELRFKFKYFIDKKAPKSGYSCPMGYDCAFEGNLNKETNKYEFILEVNVPITTLCPCSKEISDYGAHNQRTFVKLKISYNAEQILWIEDLIELVENCGSSPVYPLLKREDEKYVTERAYENPKFIEDVLRDVISELRKFEQINWFELECEAFESIHNHSAWAYQKEFLNK
ncbi:MAG: GTP cyclohydrolase FolE2 [Candidatus Gastranaerophilales bacterium]|nr:GTP cyclohydrolase FolE2 [Candidatus Gastranaerophilales bacterium]